MSIALSLVFYVFTFLLSVAFVYIGNRKKAKRFNIILGKRRIATSLPLIAGVTIPILVAGVRYDVGTDFGNYIAEYAAATQTGSYLELGFNIIAKLSYSLFGSPTFLFIAFGAMTVIPVMLGIHKSTVVRREYRWLFWLLFLFIVFPQTFNLLRQGVAVSIGFYLIITIIENRKLFRLSHLLYLLLAVSFHASAWLLVPIGYAAHLLNNKRKIAMAGFFLMTVVVMAFSIGAIPQLLDSAGGVYTGYLDNNSMSRSVVPRSLLIFFILMVCWKFYGVLKIANSYLALLWVGLLLNIGGLFVAYFERSGYYMTLLFPLTVLVMIAQAVPRKQATIVNLCLCIFALAYFVGVYYLLGSSGIFPYKWKL